MISIFFCTPTFSSYTICQWVAHLVMKLWEFSAQAHRELALLCGLQEDTHDLLWSISARAHTHTHTRRERESFPPELVSSMHILCLKPGGRKGSSTQDGDRWQIQYHRQSHHLQRYCGSECYLPSLWPQQILDQSELGVWHAAEVDSFFLGYGFQLQWHGKLKES